MVYLAFALIGFVGGVVCGMACVLVLTRDVKQERLALSDSHAEVLS